MLKSVIAGMAERVQRPIETIDAAPVTRACAYLEAAGACVLIAGVAVLLI